jgi:uncharacterized protein (TIGR04141 family)
MGNRRPTHPTNLHRLIDVPPAIDAIADIIDVEKLDGMKADIDVFDIGGAQALMVYGTVRSEAEGRRLLRITSGRPVPPLENVRSAELLVIVVDGTAYAYSYDQGWRLIPERYKDPRFGLQVAVRCLDPGQIQHLVRRRPGEKGRSDATYIPGAGPLWQYGLSQRAELVQRLAGRTIQLPTTHGRTAKRPATIYGSAGLRLPLGVEGTDLLADIRSLAEVAERPVHPALEFVDDLVPVHDADLAGVLDLELDELLDDCDDRLSMVLPESCMEGLLDAVTFTYKIGSVARIESGLDLDHVLRRTRVQFPGRRVSALRDGFIGMNRDAAGDDPLCRAAAIKWVEADLRYDDGRYVLIDGRWYELGGRYLTAVRRQVTELLATSSAPALPAWDLSRWDEAAYNAEVGKADGYLTFDRDNVQDRLHRGNGVEICDLLGPGDELIHVKKATRSAPLSHLFQQGLVSAMALKHSPGVLAKFAQKVREKGDGRRLSDDFPRKVVFAILLKDGAALTADSLFPFAQISLLHTAEVLGSHGIAVEVVGLTAMSAAAAAPAPSAA